MVTGLVLEDGGDEDAAIAAMLHDAVEDGGGRRLLESIARDFGPRVAAIVEGCSDPLDTDPATPWIERKRRYLLHLAEVTDDAILRVVVADKVHNARSIVRDYREEGHALWERFTQKTARDQLWYYGGLLAFFRSRRPGPLTEDLRIALGELSWLVARDEAQRGQELSLWLDPDLHGGQAPEAWIQVRTADEVIELLAGFRVRRISFNRVAEAGAVIGWLAEQSAAEARDRWPTDEIALRSVPTADLEQLGASIERHSRLRRSGPRSWARGPGE